MKKISLFISILLLAFSVQSQNIAAYISYAPFYSPVDGPYVETYLIAQAKTLTPYLENDQLKVEMEVTLIFRKDSLIDSFQKYVITSPAYDDSIQLQKLNLIDQQRIVLENGNYELEVIIKDLHSEKERKLQYFIDLPIDIRKDDVRFSGIQLVDSYKNAEQPGIFTKNGLDLIPYVLNFYPSNIKKLTFYSELYHMNKALEQDEGFLLSAFLQSFETQTKLSKYVHYRRDKAKTVNILVHEFDIEDLPSGNYLLTLESRNKLNELVATENLFFQRSNPNQKIDLMDISAINIDGNFTQQYQNLDSLKEMIRSLAPISNELEKVFADNLTSGNDIELAQKYLYSFWLGRDELEPQRKWNEYQHEVAVVQKEYGNRVIRGYESDRGRVYLQYGPPNSVVQRHHESSNYPYEIWHYYTLGLQKNKKFVFYTTTDVGREFELLHSDALGEIYNPRWQVHLSRRNTPVQNIDQNEIDDVWGNDAKKTFNNPY